MARRLDLAAPLLVRQWQTPQNLDPRVEARAEESEKRHSTRMWSNPDVLEGVALPMERSARVAQSQLGDANGRKLILLLTKIGSMVVSVGRAVEGILATVLGGWRVGGSDRGVYG